MDQRVGKLDLFAKYRKKTKGLCAIEIGSDGMAVVYIPNVDSPDISVCEYHPCEKDRKLSDCLLEAVLRNKLQGTKCNWILNPSYYRLLLVDTPNVPASEYKTAIRWQVKDIVNYPLDDVAIDIFFPNQDPQSNINKIFVVVAQSSFLQQTITTITNCQLEPAFIDIREFASRNLITTISPTNDSIGFINVIEDKTLFMVVYQKTVSFVRYIPISLKAIQTGNVGQLAQEIQKSASYCESEFHLPLPESYFVAPNQFLDITVLGSLEAVLGKKVNTINVNNIAKLSSPLNFEQQIRCWVAIGGALRKM